MGTKDDAETIIANLRFAIRQASAGGGDGVVHLSSEACRKALDEIDRLRAVEALASLLLAALEDPDATPEDETRAALDLRRALGEPTDPLAALEGAERALLVAGGWRRLRGDMWAHDAHGEEHEGCAVIIERRRCAEKREKKAGAL